MSDYDIEARQDAADELAPKSQGGSGQVIVVTTPGAGAFDAATDTTSAAAPIERTGSGIVLEYTTFIRSGLQNQPGTVIKAGDKQMLLSPFGVDGLPLEPPPAVDDLVELEDGSKFTIASFAPLSPAGTAIYFDCNIRGAR
jgi:hypothetical protein